MIFQVLTIMTVGSLLYHYNLKNRSLLQEISYLDEMLESDKVKLKVFKAKYAWISSPEMLAKLSNKYLNKDIKVTYGFDVNRTYNASLFQAKVNPRLYTSIKSKSVVN